MRQPLRVLVSPVACYAQTTDAPKPIWLTDSEEGRLMSLPSSLRQSEYLACRYALRTLLSNAQHPAAEWRLTGAAGAPPALDAHYHGNALVQRIALSLSHSRGYIACAAAEQAVGVDIEAYGMGRQRDVMALAQLSCTPVEQAQLQMLQGADLEAAFYRQWCVKEAYFKCLGTGMDVSSVRLVEAVEALEAVEPPTAQRTPLAYACTWAGATPEGAALMVAVCVQSTAEPLQNIALQCADGVDLDSGQIFAVFAAA